MVRLTDCSDMTLAVYYRHKGAVYIANSVLDDVWRSWCCCRLNHIAPRKAKIACNFGLSGCNRVKSTVNSYCHVKIVS